MSISQPFEELQGWNSELKLITPISIKKNFKTIVWSRISIHFCSHLKIWNPSIISHFITACNFGEILVKNPRWLPCFSVFENSKMIVWSRMSIRFYRHLKIQNLSIISRFIHVCKIGDTHTYVRTHLHTKPLLI